MAQDRDRRVGTSSVGGRVDQGVHHIKAAANSAGGGVANKGSVLALDGVDGSGVITTWYFYTDNAGMLRRASTFPADTNTGTAV